MKTLAISVRAPWAWLFFPEFWAAVPEERRHLPAGGLEASRIELPGPKDVENRRWWGGDKRPPLIAQLSKHKGPLAIHCAQGMEKAEREWAAHFQLDYFHSGDLRLPRGCLLGLVDLVEVRSQGGLRQPWASPWHERMCYGIYVAHPRLLPEPIQYKGALHAFEVEVEDPITAAAGGEGE